MEPYFSQDFLDAWNVDLERMNEKKEGKKYKHPESFILVIGYRSYFHLPHMQTQGIIKATTGKILRIFQVIHRSAKGQTS